jgi:hypothetical protein
MKMSVPRFLTFRLASTSKTVEQYNPICMRKDLDSIAGKVKNASTLNDGTRLVEISN